MHPLIRLMKIKEQAIRSRAEPRILKAIEDRIATVAGEVRGRWQTTNSYFPVVTAIDSGGSMSEKDSK